MDSQFETRGKYDLTARVPSAKSLRHPGDRTTGTISGVGCKFSHGSADEGGINYRHAFIPTPALRTNRFTTLTGEPQHPGGGN
jgi:hypothetical protein